MSRLAADNRVVFVESLGLRRPQLSARDFKRMWRRLRRAARRVPVRPAGVTVISPLVVPLHSNVLVRRLNRFILRRLVARTARRMGLRSPVLWAYNPQAEGLIEVLRPATVIYHCVDDVAEQKGVHAAAFRASEERFARRADLVIASAPALADRMRELSANVLEAPNVADTQLFSSALEPGRVDSELAVLPGPRIVFQGAIVATKLDVPLILEMAALRPGWSFAFVGPVGAGDPGTDITALGAAPNIHLLGSRPYSQLPSVLRGADAAIIPYAINALTRSVSPMKVFEYMAAGIPVASTPLPAMADTEGVRFAADAAGLVQALEEEMEADSPERRLARSQAASRYSWEARLDEIEDALPPS